jgi:hypothetical protein
MAAAAAGRGGRWPIHGWIGIGLVALFWPLNWLLTGLRTHWGFFPLWLGYALTVDALAFRARGHSLFSRNRAAWAGLFLVSAPAWWLFELINLRTRNWFYLGEEAFTTLEYALLSTLSFSTVMPALFGTAAWAGSFGWLRRLPPGPLVKSTPAFRRGMTASGAAMLLLLLVWPELFFPFVWISLYGLLDPLNVRLGNPSLLADLSRGDWRRVIALALGGLICGFFWELWNVHSCPKWIYRIPYADVLPLFEMPLPGYLGYIPFSCELYALYHLLTGFLHPLVRRQDLHLITGSAPLPRSGRGVPPALAEQISR